MHLMQVAPRAISRSISFDQHSGNACSYDTPASDILDDGFDPAIARLIAPPAGAVQAVSSDGIVPVPLH